MATKGIDKFRRELIAAAKDIQSSKNMRIIGEFAADRVRIRTRTGKGVEKDGGNPRSLKPLSTKYKEQRKKKPLSSQTSPGKSNLTRTGQMLDSLSVTKVTEGSVTIGASGSRSDTSDSNRDVAGFVSKARPFLNLSKAEISGIQRLISEMLSKILKSI